MSMDKEIREWQEKSFVHTLAGMGVKAGDTVVDFGCGSGNYSFAVSFAVGRAGKVYAVDRNPGVLEGIRQEAEKRDVQNIIPTQPESGGGIPLENDSAGMVMIYDLIHDLGGQKQHVLEECRRILKTGGILSIAPFHMGNRQILKMAEEIEKNGFTLNNTQEKKALHFEMHKFLYNTLGTLEDVEKGTIYNFIKI